ncbi:hypothetical protein EFA69_15630 [Rufibacter immobilis]|uniref:Poly(3-hydroxyalkanoate) polymerase subunit PhaE n=1 Tax=Rufibacter immobilis TaxID=1348778 RepID=A0A3M9MPU9_9BACT|nr:poly(R)-hydroxyalkanoic acid synthase subunit PhaE [Rufibacter immobilis]RNI27554.1 hypothetical protein EFA69_15630 [Rufibacter immobilis]
MEQTTTIFDTWVNTTSKLVNDWREMTEKLNSEQKNIWEEAGKMQQTWMHSFQNMMQNMQMPFMSGANAGVGASMQDAFFNMLRSTDIYTQLFQLWQPVFRAMQNNSFQNQDFWKLIDPQGFKSIVDKLFGFDAVGPMKTFMDQSTQVMNMWMNSFSDAGKNMGQMFGNGMPFFNAMSQMNPQSMMNWYIDMARSAQRSMAPFLGSTSNGTMPSMQHTVELMEQWGNYMAKLNQLQTMLYKTSVSAWEKVMQTVTDRAKDGTMVTDFNQFYNEWSTINEREYVALFNTDEYAALQAELIKLNSDLNKMYERQMEAFLQPYPVVFRSQLEEVYKVNHELRSRINTLERMVTELQNTAKATPAPTSTTPPEGQETKPGKKDK